jgi:hypothetical protein
LNPSVTVQLPPTASVLPQVPPVPGQLPPKIENGAARPLKTRELASLPPELERVSALTPTLRMLVTGNVGVQPLVHWTWAGPPCRKVLPQEEETEASKASVNKFALFFIPPFFRHEPDF